DGGTLREHREVPEASLLLVAAGRTLLAGECRSRDHSRRTAGTAAAVALSAAGAVRLHPGCRILRLLQLPVPPLWDGIPNRSFRRPFGFSQRRGRPAAVRSHSGLERESGARPAVS